MKLGFAVVDTPGRYVLNVYEPPGLAPLSFHLDGHEPEENPPWQKGKITDGTGTVQAFNGLVTPSSDRMPTTGKPLRRRSSVQRPPRPRAPRGQSSSEVSDLWCHFNYPVMGFWKLRSQFRLLGAGYARLGDSPPGRSTFQTSRQAQVQVMEWAEAFTKERFSSLRSDQRQLDLPLALTILAG